MYQFAQQELRETVTAYNSHFPPEQTPVCAKND